ncbi:MAG: hypothetical protein RLZZ540_2243 [Bacteroidota bacterium]|jgi:hypothetical protein
MKTIQIPAVIRPALKSELFGASDIPFSNLLFFSKKNSETLFYGPYYVQKELNLQTFIHRFIFRELYVIITEGEGFCFLMNLRLAERFDLVDGRYIRENQLYYIKESEEVIDGPYFLTKETDLEQIKKLYENQNIYVVDENQSFTPYTLKKIA